MTGPAWDGSGTDPWLPHRLDALTEAAEHELAVRESFWAELVAWLTRVHRAVMRSVVPDAHAVSAEIPAWQRAVARIVAGPITDAIGASYEILLGDGYEFDKRPAVVRHLANVTNRMVRTADHAFDRVASEVAMGASLGESIPEISDRIDVVLSATETEWWPNRATVVARTETIGALNAGRVDSFVAVAEELDEPFEQMWLATDDMRTRPTHRAADGQRVPLGQPFTIGEASLMHPGDPAGPAKEVIQCRCTTLLLKPGETIDLSRRQMR
jgi:Phage Mu protein F like protein